MQSVYLNYLINKNKTPSCKLEEAISVSPATISRIKAGSKELPREEFGKLIQAAGGDLASYDAFCDTLTGSPKLIKEGEEPVSVATVRKFYRQEMDELERRYLAEIDRLTQQNEIHKQHMSDHHKERVKELKEDLEDLQKKLDAANEKLEGKKATIELLHKSVSRWRTSFFVMFTIFTTQWLLDWLVFHDIGFIVRSALKPDLGVDISILRG